MTEHAPAPDAASPKIPAGPASGQPGQTPLSDQTVPSCSPRPRARRTARWRRLLLYAVILFCGVVIGVGLTLGVLRSRVLKMIHHPEQQSERVARRIDGLLDLSPEQDVKVRAILDERMAGFRDIRQQVLPRVRTELDRLQEEVAAVLDEEQRATWNERFDHLRDTWLPKPHANAGAPAE